MTISIVAIVSGALVTLATIVGNLWQGKASRDHDRKLHKASRDHDLSLHRVRYLEEAAADLIGAASDLRYACQFLIDDGNRNPDKPTEDDAEEKTHAFNKAVARMAIEQHPERILAAANKLLNVYLATHRWRERRCLPPSCSESTRSEDGDKQSLALSREAKVSFDRLAGRIRKYMSQAEGAESSLRVL